MFVLQSGGEQGHSWNNGPLKLHRFGLAEENGKAGRIGYQTFSEKYIFN